MPGITVTVPFGKTVDRLFGTQPVPYTPEVAERFVAALVQEIAKRSRLYRKLVFTTVFFGGSGPSLLTLDQLYRIIQALYDHLTIQPEEQTLLVLPDTVDRARAKVLKESGFDQLTLRVNTRSPLLPETDFHLLREAGFFSVGLEFPNPALEQAVERLFSLKPDHIHFYPQSVTFGLTGRFPGYIEYLPGHLALPGKENRHLLKLAHKEPVVGFGPGAPTRVAGKFRENPKDFAAYLKSV